MSSRRGDTVYEERDYYERAGPPPVRTRERSYEETDIYSRRDRESNRPDFLREDYSRVDPRQLVLRERDTEIISRPVDRRPRSLSPPVRIQRETRERIVRRSPSPPPPVQVERIRARVVERETEPTPPPPERLRARVIETRERVRERSPSPVRIRERIIERERSPSPVRIRERIVEKERQRSLSQPRIDTVRIRNIEREARRAPSPSPSPSPSPPPPIRAPPIHQEIITHHRHIDHGFERARVPTPPPPPPRRKEVTETDIGIYKSRNNTEIDITKISRSKTPQPPSRRDDFYEDTSLFEERDRTRVRERTVDIGRRRSLSARPEVRERERIKVDIRDNYGREKEIDIRESSGRERETVSIRDDDDEADVYRRKVEERAYIGEAYNGATKGWAIVDVPPGTERVQMDGIGGASQEISWQKYNGVRRSKFIPERERIPERLPERDRERVEIRERIEEPRRESSGLEIEISSSSRRREDSGNKSYEREYERIEETTTDRRVGMSRPQPKNRAGDLWTEITKDLVVEEAIKELGYDYEETEFFYYIIQYLRYEDVLELVQLSEYLRRERQQHIREIERERERFERRAREREEWERAERRRERDSAYDDERVIEREIIYEGGGGSGRRGPRSRAGW